MTDQRIQSQEDVIDASHVVVREGMMPSRIVLRKLDGKYVTHAERLVTAAPEDGSSCRFVHHGFDHGHYFDHGDHVGRTETQALELAIADFRERARKL